MTTNVTAAAVPPAPPAAAAPAVPPAPDATTDASAAKAAKAAEKAAKAAEKAAEKAKKDADKAAKKAEREAKAAEKAKAKEKMPMQNNVRMPRPGGLCAQAWDIASSLVKDGVVPSMAEVLEAAKAKGLNEGNVRTEYARWRTFHGYPAVGRKKVEAPAVPAAPAEVPPAPTE